MNTTGKNNNKWRLGKINIRRRMLRRRHSIHRANLLTHPQILTHSHVSSYKVQCSVVFTYWLFGSKWTSSHKLIYFVIVGEHLTQFRFRVIKNNSVCLLLMAASGMPNPSIFQFMTIVFGNQKIVKNPSTSNSIHIHIKSISN